MRRSEAIAEPGSRERPGPVGSVDGILLLDKPSGMSSNAALQRVRRLFGRIKAGHTGSLDPLASGLLPICLGRATRLSGYLLDAAKAYRVSGRLGSRTTTGDTEGEVVQTCEWAHVDRTVVADALEGFRGRIAQVPPMYSAVKQGGERLYRKARRGETVERKPREVEIHGLALTDFRPPDFDLDVTCSKGTYVRTLVEDVAAAAGSCAHVTALRRYAAGPFGEKQMHRLEELEAMAADDPQALVQLVIPPDAALPDMAAISLDAAQTGRILTGQAVEGSPGAFAGPVRLYGPDGFLGIGTRSEDGRVAPKRLMGAPGPS